MGISYKSMVRLKTRFYKVVTMRLKTKVLIGILCLGSIVIQCQSCIKAFTSIDNLPQPRYYGTHYKVDEDEFQTLMSKPQNKQNESQSIMENNFNSKKNELITTNNSHDSIDNGENRQKLDRNFKTLIHNIP